jgi:very-short-patch-repair endonuclease
MARRSREAILSIAAEQHGVFSTAQATGAGVPRHGLYRWKETGEIHQIAPSVWLVAGSPDTPARLAMAAVVRRGPDAALSRTSAGWLWEVPGHTLDPIRVLRARTNRAGSIGSHHTSRSLDASDLTVRRGIPVTTPVRTIFDLAACQHELRTRRDLNNLTTRGLITLSGLDEGLDRLGARGRTGIGVMRKLIVELREKGAPAGSNLELVAEEVLQMAGFRGFERQVEIGDDEGFIARVDFAHRRTMLAIEVDSDRFHGGLVDRMLDEEKSARLTQAGWRVARITEHELWWQRAALVQRLRTLGLASGPRARAAS